MRGAPYRVHSFEEIEPGARLVEKDLCQDLNVSRTSLREALRELEAEGLVESGARGLAVARITPAEARNIYAVRGALEGLVAAQFAELADAGDMQAIADVMSALERAYRDDDFSKIVSEKDRQGKRLRHSTAEVVALPEHPFEDPVHRP